MLFKRSRQKTTQAIDLDTLNHHISTEVIATQ